MLKISTMPKGPRFAGVGINGGPPVSIQNRNSMKKYYLSRMNPSQRYRLEKAPMQGAEVIGPIPTFAEAKAKQNAKVVKPQRKRGRPAKDWERFEMKLDVRIHDRLLRRAAELGEDRTAVVERILDAGLPK